jgi:MFS family permease
MGSVATILLWGNLYGLLNIKWLYTLGYGLFAIGNLACAASNTMNGEIIGRVIGGIGGASVSRSASCPR